MIRNLNLSLSEERSARAEGARRVRCSACRSNCARCAFCTESESGAAASRRPRRRALQLDESELVHCRAVYLSRRHLRLAPTSPRTRRGYSKQRSYCGWRLAQTDTSDTLDVWTSVSTRLAVAARISPLPIFSSCIRAI